MKRNTVTLILSCVSVLLALLLALLWGGDIFKMSAWEANGFLIALLAVGILVFLLFGGAGLLLYFRSRVGGSNYHDAFTGLLNRKGLAAQYRAIPAGLRKYMNSAVIAYNAEELHEHFSTEKCEEVEKMAASVLASEQTANNYTARISEGEFALLMYCRDGVYANQRINELVSKLNDHAARLVGPDTVVFRSGLGLADKARRPFDEAYENAAVACRYAKDNDLTGMVCTKELLVMEESKKQLKALLEDAIDTKQFDMFLQFVYDVKQKRFTGAEVLSRWNKPDEGYLMPAYYINNMHQTGVIGKFDQYMLEKTFAQLDKWNGTEYGDLVLSCNVTRVSISSPDFVRSMQKALKKYKFDHSRLIIEITEDSLIGSQVVAQQNVDACRAEGFRIAIDDFGMGNSSVNDISNYPIDQLKLDRHLILNTTTKRGRDLFSSLVRFAHEMNLEVVCEGVETEKQRTVAADAGCDLIQGYLYSYVLDMEEAMKHYQKSLEKEKV